MRRSHQASAQSAGGLDTQGRGLRRPREAQQGPGRPERGYRDHTDHAHAYCNRGVVHQITGAGQRAIADFTRAIQLRPEDARYYNNRGVAYSSVGRFDLAIADFDKAIGLDPRHAKAHKGRGVGHLNRGDYLQALVDLDKAIELDPTYLLAYSARGSALTRLGRWGKLVRNWRSAVEQVPEHPEVMNQLAWVLATSEDPKFRHGAEAVRLAERSCRLTRYSSPRYLRTLAAAYAETSQFDRAVKAAERAAKIAVDAGNEQLAQLAKQQAESYRAKGLRSR